jgi:hypothetical protein
MLDNPVVAAAATFAVLVLLHVAYILVVSGGSWTRFWRAHGVAKRWLNDKDFAAKVDALAQPPKFPEPVKANPEPIRLIALLQRDGRLVDFLLEDVSGADDTQLGAGVRDIHDKCRKTLAEHLVLEPVLSQEEETTVEVPSGFDPSAIRLVGNVTGQPPFTGVLKHRGWRVKEIKLGPLPPGSDHFVVQPAEVELP